MGLPQHDRRSFLELAISTTALALPAGQLASRAQQGSQSRQLASVDAAILGEAVALENQSHHKLRAHWAQIAAQAVLMERDGLSLEAAVQNIRKGVRDGFRDYPTAFAEVSRLLEPPPGEPMPVARLSLVGSVGGLGGYVAFVAPPPTAVAAIASGVLLGILGYQADQFGGSVDKAIAATQVSPPSDWQVYELTAWAASAYYRSLSTAERMVLAGELFESGQFSLDPGRSIESAADVLPETTRQMIKACRAPAADGRAIQASVNQAVASTSKRLTNTLSTTRTSQQVDLIDAEYALRELGGLGTIGAHFVGGTAGATAARVVKTYTSGLVVAVNAMRTFTGPLELIGTLVDVASSILGINLDGTDPFMEALRTLGESIAELSKRLDYIDDTQRAMLSKLSQVYLSVQANQMMLGSLRDQVANMALVNSQQFKSLSRQSFVGARDELTSFIVNNRSNKSVFNGPNETYFAARLTNCYSYATSVARDDNHTVQSSGSPTVAGDVRQALSRPGADQRVGLLPLIALRLTTDGSGLTGALRLNTPNANGVAGLTPVNPVSWAEASVAYVRSAAAFNTPLGQERDHVTQLWSEGIYLRQMILALTTPDIMSAIKLRLLKTAGDLPEVIDSSFMDRHREDPPATPSVVRSTHSALLEWDRQNVPRSLSLPLWIFADSAGQIAYSLHASIQHIAVRAVPDYLQVLIDSKNVALEITPTPNQKKIVVTAEGPWKGRDLGTIITNGNGRAYPAGPGPAFDPAGLQGRAREWAHLLVYRESARKEMPAVIEKTFGTLKSSPEAQEFMFWLVAAQTVAAYIRMRSTEQRGGQVLAIAAGDPFSMEALATAVARRLRASLSGSEAWHLQAILCLHAEVVEQCDKVIAAASSTSNGRTGPLIDDTLRELAGFMFMRNIPRPL